MTARARSVMPPSVTVLISPVRSPAVAVSLRNSAPNRSACLRMLAIRSGPTMPSGKPGKFCTSLVVISAPPYVMPSITSGRRLARAV